jgi:hypothetical protein
MKKQQYATLETLSLELPESTRCNQEIFYKAGSVLYREDHKVVAFFANKKTFLIIAEI